MKHLYDTLESLKTYPEMWLGEKDIYRLSAFIFGFTTAKDLDFEDDLRSLLVRKHGETCLVWPAILEENYDDPFDAFFEVLEEMKGHVSNK